MAWQRKNWSVELFRQLSEQSVCADNILFHMTLILTTFIWLMSILVVFCLFAVVVVVVFGGVSSFKEFKISYIFKWTQFHSS